MTYVFFGITSRLLFYIFISLFNIDDISNKIQIKHATNAVTDTKEITESTINSKSPKEANKGSSTPKIPIKITILISDLTDLGSFPLLILVKS